MKKALALCVMVLLSIPSFAISYMFDFRPSNAVTCITHDEANIYCATRHKGLAVIDKKTGTITWYTRENGSLPSNNLQYITIHDGKLFVSDFNLGAITCVDDHETDTLRISNIESFSNIFFAADDKMIASYGGYVDVYRNGVRTDSVTINPMILDGAVWKMKSDSQGVLWIASQTLKPYHGLTTYTLQDGFSFVFEGKSELPFDGSSARGLAIDQNDHIWFCSGSGHLVDYYGDSFQVHNLGFVAEDMSFDESGRLWMITHKGELKSFEDCQVKSYSCEVKNAIGYCLDVDGDAIYFGTDNGLFKYSDGEFVVFDFSDSPALIEGPNIQLSASVQGSWFDLQGRRVANSSEFQGSSFKLPKGVYIQNGKKFVVK